MILSVVAQTLIGLLPLIQQIIVDHSILRRQRPVGPMLILLLSTGLLGFTANWSLPTILQWMPTTEPASATHLVVECRRLLSAVNPRAQQLGMVRVVEWRAYLPHD